MRRPDQARCWRPLMEFVPVIAYLIAPWIIESWRAAFESLAVDLPVITADAYAQSLILAVLSAALLWVAWVAVSGLPTDAKIVARTLLAAPLLVLPALFLGRYIPVATPLGDHPRPASVVRHSPALPAEARPGPDPQRMAAVAPTALPPSGAPAPVAAAIPPPIAVAEPVATPPPAGSPAEESSGDASGAGSRPVERDGANAGGPPARPEAAPAQSTLAYLAGVLKATPRARVPARSRERAMVPVLFATDRAPQGRGFGPGRADRLQLGRAMVAVQRPRPPGARDAPIALDAITLIDERDMAAAAKPLPDRMLVLVHGFDTGFDAAILRSAQLAFDLGFDGGMAVFSWPSAGRARDYAYDSESAINSAPHLARFLRSLSSQPVARAISVIAVGLGARTALEALRQLKDTGPGGAGADRPDGQPEPPGRLGELLLVAPDMDRGALSAAATEVAGTVSGITLYVSSRDRALNITRRYAGAVPRAGDLGEDGPLISPSVLTIDMNLSGTDPLSSVAPVYVDGGALIAHARAVLGGPAARDEAAAGLKRVETARGVYWVHPGGGGGRR